MKSSRKGFIGRCAAGLLGLFGVSKIEAGGWQENCEGCDCRAAVVWDSDDVPLCVECYKKLCESKEFMDRSIAELMPWNKPESR